MRTPKLFVFNPFRSGTKRDIRSASKQTKRNAKALAACDKDDCPAIVQSERRNVVARAPKNRFSENLKTTDISWVLKHTRKRAMDELHIENEEERVQDPAVDAKESLIDISPFLKHA